MSVPKLGGGKEESKITPYERRNGKMTKLQKHIIKCAYLDLKGSKEAALELTIEDHDWKAHEHTIEDMESVFPFLKELFK
jgi:hypothetical protein